MDLSLSPRSKRLWSSFNVWIRTLQFTFTFQVTFALVVSFALGNLILYHAASKRLFEQQERLFRTHTLYLSSGVLTWQKSIHDTMRLAASTSGVRSLDPEELATNLLPLFQQTPLRRWKVWRADGKLLLSSTPVTNILVEEMRNRQNTSFKRALSGSFNYGVNSVLSGARLEGCLEGSYPIMSLKNSENPERRPAAVLSFCLPFSKIGQDSGLIKVDQIQDGSTSDSSRNSEQLIEINRGRYKGRAFFLISPTGNLVFPTVNNIRFDHISLLSPQRIAQTKWHSFVKATLDPATLARVQKVDVDGQSYFMYTHRISDQWTAVNVVDTGSVYEPLHRNLLQLMLVQAATLFVTMIAIYVVCRQLTKPLKSIVHTVTDLSDLRIPAEQSASLTSSSIVEVRQVSNAIHRLSFAMDSFGRYLPKEVVRAVLGSNQSARLGGDAKKLVILFTDIKDFTSYSEVLKAPVLLGHLNEYLTALTDAILNTQGTIDKYIGDSIMAFWGAPTTIVKPATLACEAALAIRKETQRINEKWGEQGVNIHFDTRVGLNIGDVIVGNVGSEERFNYTVIGDPVNLASRLESANKQYGTDIMISTAIIDALQDEGSHEVYLFRLLDRIKVKGKQEVSEIHELMGKKEHFSERFVQDLNTANSIMRKVLDAGVEEGIQMLHGIPADALEVQPLNTLREILETRRKQGFQPAI